MIEWLDSIWAWLVENRDNIVAFFTSTNLVAAVTTIAALIKNIKASNNNTLSVTSIKDTIKIQQGINEDVTNVKNSVLLLVEEIVNVKNDVTSTINHVNSLENIVKQQNDELMSKVNAMLEVQSIVYSTLKDDNIRNTVYSILVSAKHSDAKSKAKLQEELDDLRNELKSKNEELDAAVNKVVEKVLVDVPIETIVKEPDVETIRRY